MSTSALSLWHEHEAVKLTTSLHWVVYMRSCVSLGEPLDAYLVAMQSLLDPRLIRQASSVDARLRTADAADLMAWAADRALAPAHAYALFYHCAALPSLTNQKCRRLAIGLWRAARSKMPTAYRPALLPAAAANIKAGAYLPVSNLAWGDDKRVIVAGVAPLQFGRRRPSRTSDQRVEFVVKWINIPPPCASVLPSDRHCW